jgi:hypothetical protein
MSKRYLLLGGWVGPNQWVSATKLEALYGLDPQDCVTITDTFQSKAYREYDYIVLHPRRDGKYRNPDGSPNYVEKEQLKEPLYPCPVRVGGVWQWEPLKPDAREDIRITGTHWNGEEWWIATRSLKTGKAHRVELDRFIEAAVLVAPPED